MIAEGLEWIKEGYYVDAKDKQGDWQIGIVLSVTKNQIKIRYDGWGSKYDQFFSLNSQKIKPFRSVIRGYTGQKRSPGIRQHWTFSLQNHEQKLFQFQQFVNHLSQKSAFEIIQFLRGFNYLYIDFLLTNSYSSLEQIKRVYDYFKTHIQFVKKYLNEFNQRDTNVWFQAGQKQQNIQKKAYSQIHFEIFDSIYSIVGSQQRLIGFWKTNQKYIRQLIGSQGNYQNFIWKQLFNCKFMEVFEQFIEKNYEQTMNGMRILPFSFINSFFWLYLGVQKLPLPKQLKKNLSSNLLYILSQYLQSLSIMDAKNNQRYIEDILGWVRLFFVKASQDKEALIKFVQRSRLKLWKYLIECDVLQKKLRGISKIKQFYELVSSKSSSPLQSSSVSTTKQQFREWFQSNQLLKILFETNEHSEVIKKGCEMLQNFYASKLCSINQIVYIWQSCFNKHEAIKKIVFQLWNDLTQYVSGQIDWRQFIGVFTKNDQQINEEWEIESLFTFLHALKSDDQNSYMHDFIGMMYQKALQNQKFISEFAREISFFGGQSYIIKKIMDNCLKMIHQKNQPIFHLKLLSKIFNQLHSYKIYIPQNIIEVLIQELKILVLGQENDKFIITIFQLFNQIMSAKDISMNQSKIKVSVKHFQTLWSIFYQLPLPSIKKIFYNWIVIRSFSATYNSSNYSINGKFTPELKIDIFNNILCNQTKFNYQKIDLNQFIVFKQLFIYINQRGSAFDVKYYGSGSTASRRILRVKSKDIKGLQELWEIFRTCDNEEVINAVSIFIKDIHLRISPLMSSEQKSQRIRKLMDIIQSYINEGHARSNMSLIRRSIILITKLLTDIKQKIQIPKEFEKLAKTQKIQLKVYTSQVQVQQFEVFVQEPFCMIKNSIAQKFGISRQQFTLVNHRSEVLRQYYELPYYLHSFQDNYFQIVKVNNQNGKYIMNYVYQNFYHKIIELLKNQYISTEAFNLLENLEVYQPIRLFQSLSKDIEEVDEIIKHKKKLYLHIYFLRVLSTSLQKEISIINYDILYKLASHLEIPIENSLIITYLEKMVEIFNYLARKKIAFFDFHGTQNDINAIDYRPKTYKLILNLIKFLNLNSQYFSAHQQKLFINSMNLYSNGFQNNIKLFDAFVKDQHFRQLMVQIFIKCQLQIIKRSMERKIALWLKEGFNSQQEQIKVAQFFINQLYYQIVDQSSTKTLNAQALTLFKIFRTILEAISLQTFNKIVFQTHSSIRNQSFWANIHKQIHHQSDTPSSTNFLLTGQLNLFSVIIKRNRSIINQQMIEYFLFECLIYQQGKTRNIDVKCLSKENIFLVLQILFNIIVETKNRTSINNKKFVALTLDRYAQKIFTTFKEFHYFEYWRLSKDWYFDFQQLSKTKSQFVGLQNPGCICYLNSLLQQLYMIEEFRYSILGIEANSNKHQFQIESASTFEDSPELLSKLKLLFLNLMYSEKPAIDPQFFTASIRNASNRPMVKIYEQMDIDEFSMILFDKLQNKLQKMNYPNFIRDLFGGLYSNEIISQQCNHSSEREQQFLSISLDVKKHITESFQSLVKGQMLEGQNAYFCDRCDKKVKALKRLSIKRLPPHLIISLRRFQFDYEIDQKIKINKYCEFPFQLNLEEYSQDKLNQMNKKSQRISGAEQDLDKKKQHKFSSEYYIYKLKGVVIHSGSADSGHYYSFIEGKSGNWFQFNDQKVSQFDLKNLQQEAFGGKDGQYSRIKNAYLLFYERKAVNPFDQKNRKISFVSEQRMSEIKLQGNDEMMGQAQLSCFFNTPSIAQLEQPKQLLSLAANKQIFLGLEQNRGTIEQIIKENKKIRIFQFYFSRQYSQFVYSLVKQIWYKLYSIPEDQNFKNLSDHQYMLHLQNSNNAVIAHAQLILNNEELIEQFFKFLVSYTFLVNLRQKNLIANFQFLSSIKQIYFKASVKKKYYIQVFIQEASLQPFFDQFFLYCINRDKSKAVAVFIFQAIQAYLADLNCQQNPDLPSIVIIFLKATIKNIIKTQINIPQLVMIIRKLIVSEKINKKYVTKIIYYILEKEYINILLDNALGNPVSEQLQQLRLNLLQSQNGSAQSSQQICNKIQRKNSNLSAKDQNLNEQIPNKKQHNIEFNQIENQQQNLDKNSLYGGLFGYYKPQGKLTIKTYEKEAWTLLWIIYKMIKNFSKKQNSKYLSSNNKYKFNNQGQYSNRNDVYVIQKQQSPQKIFSPIQPQRISQSLHQSSRINSPNQQSRQTNSKSEVIRISSSYSTQNCESSTVKPPLPSYSPHIEEQLPEQQHRQGSEREDNEHLREQNTEEPVIDMENNIENQECFQDLRDIVSKHFIQIPIQAKLISDGNTQQNQTDQVNENRNITDQDQDNNTQQIFSSQSSQQAQEQIDVTITNARKPQNQNQKSRQVICIDDSIQQKSNSQNLILQNLPRYSESINRFYQSLQGICVDKFKKLISQQKDSKLIIAFSTFVSQFVDGNPKLNQVLLNSIEASLKQYQSIKFRPFFLLIEKLIEIEDDLAPKRILDIIKIFRQALRHNQKFFLECDFIHQWLLRYATINSKFCKCLSEMPVFINQIKSWISQKRCPTTQSIRKHRQPNCQRHVYRLHGIIVSCQMKQYESLALYKFESFEKIKKNQFVPNIKYHNEPIIGEEYQKNSIVQSYFDHLNTWLQGTINESYYGYLYITFVFQRKPQKNFINEDDQKLVLKKRPNKIC